MKILIDASLCSKGGGVQVALSIINNIVLDPNFKVIFIATPELDNQITEIVKDRISFYYVESNENIFRKKQQGRRIAEIEKKHVPDLVFVVFGPSYWRPKAKTLQGFALPLLVYPAIRNRIYKSNILKFVYQKILNKYKAVMMRQNADYLVVETQTFKKRAHEALNFPLDRIFVIENSFNSNFKKNDDNLITISNDDGINKFLIPSAYYPHKNLEILVGVARNLVEKGFSNFVFNFLIDPTSKEWAFMHSKASEAKVDNFFNTYGQVQNVRMKSLYNQNDFVILPTLAEASTAVYPEAFASERVLLTSDVDFARELCGDAAIYFNPYDSNQIAETIIDITQNLESQKRLIELGKKQITLSYVTPEVKWLKQQQLILDLIHESI